MLYTRLAVCWIKDDSNPLYSDWDSSLLPTRPQHWCLTMSTMVSFCYPLAMCLITKLKKSVTWFALLSFELSYKSNLSLFDAKVFNVISLNVTG